MLFQTAAQRVVKAHVGRQYHDASQCSFCKMAPPAAVHRLPHLNSNTIVTQAERNVNGTAHAGMNTGKNVNYLWYSIWNERAFFGWGGHAILWKHMHILVGTDTSIIKHVISDVMTPPRHGSRPRLSPPLLKSHAEQSQPLLGHSPSSGFMVSLILKCKCILTHVESLFILKLKCRVGHDVLWFSGSAWTRLMENQLVHLWCTWIRGFVLIR